MSRIKGLAAVIWLLAMPLTVTQASARSIGVQPLLVDVAPGQNAAIRVRNSADVPTTVDVTVEERSIDAAGVQGRKAADDAFVVFPPQATIAPNGSQVFRVQAIDATATTSKSYFLTVQQVPVEFKPTNRPEGGAQLQVLFAFDVAVHVVPRGAKAELAFVSARSAQSELVLANPATNLANTEAPLPPPIRKTVPAVSITIRNDGNKYLYLQDYEYLVSGDDASGSRVERPAPTVREIIDAAGVTLVLPGATREFKLPLPEGSALRNVAVRVRERPRG
jgi:fimbrial chaperone protein